MVTWLVWNPLSRLSTWFPGLFPSSWDRPHEKGKSPGDEVVPFVNLFGSRVWMHEITVTFVRLDWFLSCIQVKKKSSTEWFSIMGIKLKSVATTLRPRQSTSFLSYGAVIYLFVALSMNEIRGQTCSQQPPALPSRKFIQILRVWLSFLYCTTCTVLLPLALGHALSRLHSAQLLLHVHHLTSLLLPLVGRLQFTVFCFIDS